MRNTHQTVLEILFLFRIFELKLNKTHFSIIILHHLSGFLIYLFLTFNRLIDYLFLEAKYGLVWHCLTLNLYKNL